MAFISNFIAQQQIPTNLIGVFLNDDGKKKPIGDKNSLSLEEIATLKNGCHYETMYGNEIPTYKKEYTENGTKITMSSLKQVEKKKSLYLKYVPDLYCVDVDEKEIKDIETFGYFKDCVWKQGNNKGLHIYIFIKNVPPYTQQQKIWHDEKIEVDLLKQTNTWEDDKKPIYNFREDGKYPVYEWCDIKHLFNESKMTIGDKKKTVQKKNKPEELKSNDKGEEHTMNDKNYDIAKRCLNALAIHRIENYGSWFKIGCILYKEFKQNGYNLFNECSKRASNYDANGVESNWWNISQYDKYDVSIGTLIMWAREDNPEFCVDEEEEHFKVKKSINFEKLNHIYYKALYERDDRNIANLIKYLYPDYFVSNGKDLYFFNQYGIYKKDNDGYYLNQIFEGIIKHLDLMLLKINEFEEFKTKADMDDEKKADIKEQKKLFTAHIKNVNKYFGTVKHRKDIKTIMTQITIVQKLDEKMDETNKDAVGFENGIYDLVEKRFRKGKPSDFVSMTTGYKYFEESEEKKHRVLEIIASMWDTPDKAKYFLHKLAYTLTGNKTKQEVNIHNGIGSNGKSIIFDFLKKTLGEYFGVMNADYFITYEKGANRANSELANTKGKRIVLVSEPPENAKLQVDKLKKISGNEIITTRHLFGNPIEFYPQYILHILTNDIPQLSKMDGGIQRRLKIIDYPFVFKNKEEYTGDHPNIKLSNPNLSNEINGLTMALFHVLVDNFDRDYIEIDDVKESTKEYIADNNPVASWIEENFIITHNDLDCDLFIDDMTRDFCDETGLTIDTRYMTQRIQQLGVAKPYRSTGGRKRVKGMKRKEVVQEYIEEDDAKTIA